MRRSGVRDQMNNSREDLTPEEEAQIVRDYGAGAKTVVLQLEHKIAPGTLYRILHKHGVTFRGRTGPITPKLKKIRAPVVKKLLELSHAEVERFRKSWESLTSSYGEGSAVDAYSETWIDFTEHVAARLEYWLATLGEDAAGIALGLVAFKESIQAIEKLDPEKTRGTPTEKESKEPANE